MSEDRFWLKSYPEGVPADIDPGLYASLPDLMARAFQNHDGQTGYHYMGRDITFRDTAAHVRALAAYLQSLGLTKGDRVAIMLPNMPQYAEVVGGILTAGYIAVNVNPLYTARELEHQLNDCGAKAIFVVENCAATLAKCIAQTKIEHVVTTAVGDRLGWLRRWIVNAVVRRGIPPFALPGAVPYLDAVARGRKAAFTSVPLTGDDVAVLQYTGGTTGVSKGAMLTHRNLIANTLQACAWFQPALARQPAGEQHAIVAALPLYHIFGFTSCLLLGLHLGAKCILIPNPRDLDRTFKTLASQRFHNFPAVNTLFNGLLHHPGFGSVDWSHLLVTIGGGMAVQRAVADQWRERTGCPICEGYGLSETSPTISCNPVTASAFSGTAGLPLPSTLVKILDETGTDAPRGQAGELAVKGPQVMAGYWLRPDETRRVMTADGYLKTGDVALLEESGDIRIVDRKKDMILVSGFNVYPNEVEDVVAALPGVREVAVVGVPDPDKGEAVKLVLVCSDDSVTEKTVRAWCAERLTGYKRPSIIEFRHELPKSAVGKVLRRELRNTASTASAAPAARGAGIN